MPNFPEVYTSARRWVNLLRRIGCEVIKSKHGFQSYHYHSGFFRFEGRLWYLTSSDDRNYPFRILVRRAKHEKDYAGEVNRYPRDEEGLVRILKMGV